MPLYNPVLWKMASATAIVPIIPSVDIHFEGDIEGSNDADHEIRLADKTAGIGNDGVSLTIKAGNGFSSTAAPASGGSVLIKSGEGDGDAGPGGAVTLDPGDTEGVAQLGAAITDLAAFYGGPGQPQPAAIANADGTLADLTTKFNTLLGYLRNFSQIAT